MRYSPAAQAAYIATLEKRIDAVLTLHQPGSEPVVIDGEWTTVKVCSTCFDYESFGDVCMERWPCPTAAALGVTE